MTDVTNEPVVEMTPETDNSTVSKAEDIENISGQAASTDIQNTPVEPLNKDEFGYVPEKFKADGKPQWEKLAQSYTALEKKLGNVAELPPKSAEEYKYDFDESIKIDQEAYDSFKDSAHKMGFNQSQYNFIMAAYEGMVKEGSKTVEKAADTLKKTWGDEFDSNLSAANKAISTYSPEGFDIRKHPHLANDPTFAMLMAHIGRGLDEDHAPSERTSSAPSYSELEIQAMMKENDYWTNPVKQKIVSGWFKRRYD